MLGVVILVNNSTMSEYEITNEIKVITNFIDELILDNTVFKGKM